MFRKIVLFPTSGGKIRARDPTPLGPLPDLVSKTGPHTEHIPYTKTVGKVHGERESKLQAGKLGNRSPILGGSKAVVCTQKRLEQL
jgi:hypothetical protein